MSSIEELKGLAKKLAEECNSMSSFLNEQQLFENDLLTREFNQLNKDIKSVDEYEKKISGSLGRIGTYLKECREKYNLYNSSKNKKQKKK